MKILLKIKDNVFIFITFCIGIALRVYFGLCASISVSQHDVMSNNGHFEYAKYIFKNGKLPLTNEWQFYQPPLNAILQSFVMRVAKFFTGSKNIKGLYSYSKFLTILYSIIALIFMYLILKKFCNRKFVRNFAMLILSVYPGLIFMATQYNNDPPAFMFFFMSIYFAITWTKSLRLRDIIFTAICIGLGMLTKISVGLTALIIGPMMLVTLIKNKKVFLQIIIFALIVFPLGLSYAVRNYMMFGQSINYVPKVTAEIMQVGSFSFIDRFLTLPLDRLFFGKFGIYHDIREYNVWVDLIKTATFDETIYLNTKYHLPCVILLYLNFSFYVLSFIATIYAIYRLFRKKDTADILIIISLALIIISIISYVAFNITHPASCTSSYRYVSYQTFAFAYLLGIMFYDMFNKMSRKQ